MRACSSAAPAVRRMSRLVGSSTRPTRSVASGSGSPVGSGEPPAEQDARTSDAAATATAATRPQGGNDDEDMRIPSGGPSGAGDCGADEAGELEVRGLLDVVARRDRMDGGAGARGAEGVDVRAGAEAVIGGDEVDRRGR